MESTQPATILRNYSKVLDDLDVGKPIILTKNGVGKAALVNIEQWDRLQTEIRLLKELNKAEKNFGEGVSLEEFRKSRN
ncbi:type II toxin-antitoxin system prevent-host-death family antitoxin [Ligilactobacillus salivarius]|uniref:type II toxin-antitoxin system prevent-host-death family antitoxin n=1 Tax=Ligilactobacillus salivarius TaxID=1624 RepID=UPI00399693C4